jgi:hypothetical protein
MKLIEDACLRQLLQADMESRVIICKKLLRTAEAAAKEHACGPPKPDPRQIGLFDTVDVNATPASIDSSQFEYPKSVRKAFFNDKDRIDRFHVDLFGMLHSLKYQLMSDVTLRKAEQIVHGLWQQNRLEGYIESSAETPEYEFISNTENCSITFQWVEPGETVNDNT